MTSLSVNLNKIALLRNSRGRNYPDIETFAKIALDMGARGVTIHPRRDQRHARYQDAVSLKKLVENFPGAELNIEGYPDETFLKMVLEVLPHQCTLVPDAPDQVTSDHGWDLMKQADVVTMVIKKLKSKKIRTSLFMDPDIHQIELAKKTGADRIELYTEAWAMAYQTKEQQNIWQQYYRATQKARILGLEVNAGHDLNLDNLAAFLQIGGIDEVSIGHALIVESLHLGFPTVVKQYVEICRTHS